MKLTMQVVGGLLAFVVLIAVTLVLSGAIEIGSQKQQAVVAKATNPDRETRIVFDPNRSLSTYEGFYDKCNTKNAALAKAADAQNEAAARQKAYRPKADPFGNEQRGISQLREAARSQRNQARDLAAEYNADAAKNTRAPFLAADLPYTLSASEQDECGAPKEAGR